MNYSQFALKAFSVLFLSFSLYMTSCSSGDEEEIINNPPQMMDDEEEEEDNLVAAPSFSLVTPSGGSINSVDYKDKVLVIFFFGSSCPPCIAAGPSIESKLNAAFGSKPNFAIIGGDQWDGNAASVESFASKAGVTFPLGVMASSMAKDFETTYDRLVIVNAKGKIAFKGSSIASNDLDEVVDIVKGLVN